MIRIKNNFNLFLSRPWIFIVGFMVWWISWTWLCFEITNFQFWTPQKDLVISKIWVIPQPAVLLITLLIASPAQRAQFSITIFLNINYQRIYGQSSKSGIRLAKINCSVVSTLVLWAINRSLRIDEN